MRNMKWKANDVVKKRTLEAWMSGTQWKEIWLLFRQRLLLASWRGGGRFLLLFVSYGVFFLVHSMSYMEMRVKANLPNEKHRFRFYFLTFTLFFTLFLSPSRSLDSFVFLVNFFLNNSMSKDCKESWSVTPKRAN